MKRYSVIIPCHNEAGAIEKVLLGVKKYVPDAEIIVIDDGSDDETSKIASSISGIKLVRFEENMGKGVAIREGIKLASGDVLLFMDGDGQDDPADLLTLIQEVEKGSAFVNGSKFIGRVEKGGLSTANRFGNKFMSLLINLLFGTNVTDSQSGFRAISSELAKSLRLSSSSYEIETEMLIKALRAGIKVVEVPVTRRARSSGKSGFRRIKNGLKILLTILRERFSRD